MPLLKEYCIYKILAFHSALILREKKWLHYVTDRILERNDMESIDLLITIAKEKPNSVIVTKMKKIVPEYKSLNSAYEALDNVKVDN